MTFEEWLRFSYKKANGDELSDRSIEHYVSGLIAVSNEMYNYKVIDKKIENMDLIELDVAIFDIMNDSNFISKDEIGHKMYSNALKRYRCYLYENTDLGKKEATEVQLIEDDKLLSITEKETLIKARRGQGSFKEKLLKKYNKECLISKISIKQVLVASHIKPWAVCDNYERLDENNGLLLSATYDRLFDSGLITFKEDGSLMLSNLVNKENAKKLQLVSKAKYDIKYNIGMLKYLEYHNKYIFIGNK